MTAHIEREFDFQAGVYFQGEFLINSYEFNLYLDVNTESIREQNIAMERLKYLIYESFENTVFVDFSETKTIQKYTDAGLKVCITPEAPYDQIIALLILLKANAICEDKLKITDISLVSKLSDNVKFIENIETATGAIVTEGWWSNSTPSLCSKHQNKKEKIVKLVKDEWADLGLSWKEKKSKSTEVVFKLDSEKNPE